MNRWIKAIFILWKTNDSLLEVSGRYPWAHTQQLLRSPSLSLLLHHLHSNHTLGKSWKEQNQSCWCLFDVPCLHLNFNLSIDVCNCQFAAMTCLLYIKNVAPRCIPVHPTPSQIIINCIWCSSSFPLSETASRNPIFVARVKFDRDKRFFLSFF